MAAPWWRHGVLYEIYPRSFADSDGDGIGDLRGIVEHLEHLAWLGVDGIWLNPTFPSPNADWGYDVSDYRGVHVDLGTLGDLDRLVGEAGARGIRVVLDLVPAHTSDRHPWFVEARNDGGSSRRELYVWGRARSDGGPPNRWESLFGGGAWEPDGTGEYYLHTFLAEQPDLNWHSDAVAREFDEILRFWLDRGVAGFRIDVAHRIAKTRDVAAADSKPHEPQPRGRIQRPLPPVDLRRTHEVLKGWRTLVDAYGDDRLLLGETYVMDVADLATYYGGGADELHLGFNFPFVNAGFSRGPLEAVVGETAAVLPSAAWPVWTGSNHDVGRLATRWCDGDERKVRCALLMLLALRGTPVLYAGDEIGLPEVDVPRERVLDPVGIRGWPDERGRDRCRTPLHWHGGPGAGFTRPGVEPWLPLGDAAACNVADQRADPASTLTFVRDLLALRRAWPSLHGGDFEPVPMDGEVWAWRRGDDAIVALNLSDDEAPVPAESGTVAVSTTRDGEGAPPRSLEAWEGVIVRGEAAGR